MWTSSIYFGTFLGPTIGGVAVETWDFRTATIIYWCTFIIVLVRKLIDLSFYREIDFLQHHSCIPFALS